MALNALQGAAGVVCVVGGLSMMIGMLRRILVRMAVKGEDPQSVGRVWHESDLWRFVVGLLGLAVGVMILVPSLSGLFRWGIGLFWIILLLWPSLHRRSRS